jgi:hypothetical protein
MINNQNHRMNILFKDVFHGLDNFHHIIKSLSLSCSKIEFNQGMFINVRWK